MTAPATDRWLRIDDRLLHGQVLLAWASALHPERIILASDAVAGDPERRSLYGELPHEDFAIDVCTLAEAARALANQGRVFAVCASPAEALSIVDLGAPLSTVIVGGMHRSGAKKRLLDYVYLSPEDAASLQALLDRGVRVEARDLPGSRGVVLDAAALAAVWG